MLFASKVDKNDAKIATLKFYKLLFHRYLTKKLIQYVRFVKNDSPLSIFCGHGIRNIRYREGSDGDVF